MGLMLVVGVSEILCAITYYAILDWRTVWRCFVVIPSVIGFIGTLFIQETPNYYFTS
jgi:hypothetical protein